MKITLELPDEKELSETDRKAYCAAIFAIFPRIEKDIRKFMYEQLVSTYTEATNWDKILKGQGILEGMAILLDQWQKANNEHIANSKPQEEFDKSNPISEV
jgi:hypothetical protein